MITELKTNNCFINCFYTHAILFFKYLGEKIFINLLYLSIKTMIKMCVLKTFYKTGYNSKGN